MIPIPRTFLISVRRDEPIPKFQATSAHLQEMGVPFETFLGVDNRLCRFKPLDSFDVDKVGEHISEVHIAAHITHYLLWKVMSYCPEDSFWALEYDALFEPDWRTRYEEAMSVIPDDWDVVFLGSCCTSGRPTEHIGKNLYAVHWPLCGHAIMYRKKALEVLLEVHQKVWAPLDIALYYDSLPKLRVYTILPRIVNQLNTAMPP